MRDVLGAVGLELDHAKASCQQLDGALGRLIELVPADARGAVMQELYVVDLLSQHIGALARFIEGLEDLPADADVSIRPALDRVSLGAVAERIASTLGAATAPSGPADDLELF
jgi:hypothetical protein